MHKSSSSGMLTTYQYQSFFFRRRNGGKMPLNDSADGYPPSYDSSTNEYEYHDDSKGNSKANNTLWP